MKKVFLLTGCIKPSSNYKLKRNNPEVRRDDYLDSLKKWSKIGEKIFFYENSNYPLGSIDFLSKDVKIRQFQGKKYDPKYGKGFGEKQIIEFFLRENAKLNENALLFKVTGRYFIKNIEKIVSDITENKNHKIIYANLSGNLKYADSRVFIASKIFFEEYFLKKAEKINDSKRYYFEHALADSILEFVADGGIWKPLPRKPIIQGTYATLDKSYKNNFFFNLYGKFRHKLYKNFHSNVYL